MIKRIISIILICITTLTVVGCSDVMPTTDQNTTDPTTEITITEPVDNHERPTDGMENDTQILKLKDVKIEINKKIIYFGMPFNRIQSLNIFKTIDDMDLTLIPQQQHVVVGKFSENEGDSIELYFSNDTKEPKHISECSLTGIRIKYNSNGADLIPNTSISVMGLTKESSNEQYENVLGEPVVDRVNGKQKIIQWNCFFNDTSEIYASIIRGIDSDVNTFMLQIYPKNLP